MTSGNALLHKTFLIVDDVPLNLIILDQILQSFGANVITASSGKKALALLDDSFVDIILSDLQMPEMDGWKMTEYIRKSNKWYNRLPVVAVTAETSDAELQYCFKVGMNEIIDKPVEPSTLLQKVNNISQKEMIDFSASFNTTTGVVQKIFDLSYLREVTNGEKESLQLIVDNLVQNVPLLVDQAASAALSEDWAGVATGLHKLKGLISLFKVPCITNIIIAGEQELREANPTLRNVLNTIRSLKMHLPAIIDQIVKKTISI